MKDPLKIIGANGKRRKNDFYETPCEVTVALVELLQEKFLLRPGMTGWEPACGHNAIANVLSEKGYRMWCTDIEKGQDYLTYQMDEPFDFIITNPPFSLAEEFIRKSVEHGKPFAMLLKSQYWHSAKRRALFLEHQPAMVLPLTWRPDFTGAGASMLDMVWCVWIGTSNVTYYQPLKKPDMERRERDGRI